MCYSDAMDINALERGEHNSKYLYYGAFSRLVAADDEDFIIQLSRFLYRVSEDFIIQLSRFLYRVSDVRNGAVSSE